MCIPSVVNAATSEGGYYVYSTGKFTGNKGYGLIGNITNG